MDQITKINYNAFATWSFPLESVATFTWLGSSFLLKHTSFYNKLIIHERNYPTAFIVDCEVIDVVNAWGRE